MPRGRLIFWLYAEIAPYDTEAMETASRFHEYFREPIKTDTDGDGIGEDNRLEKDTVVLKVQVERDREELQRMTRGGDVPDSAIGLVVHMRDMERGVGVTSYVDADGQITVPRKNDRLIRLLDKRGIAVNTFSETELYCTHRYRLQADIGHTSNLALLLFAERPQGSV